MRQCVWKEGCDLAVTVLHQEVLSSPLVVVIVLSHQEMLRLPPANAVLHQLVLLGMHSRWRGCCECQ